MLARYRKWPKREVFVFESKQQCLAVLADFTAGFRAKTTHESKPPHVTNLVIPGLTPDEVSERQKKRKLERQAERDTEREELERECERSKVAKLDKLTRLIHEHCEVGSGFRLESTAFNAIVKGLVKDINGTMASRGFVIRNARVAGKLTRYYDGLKFKSAQ